MIVSIYNLGFPGSVKSFLLAGISVVNFKCPLSYKRNTFFNCLSINIVNKQLEKNTLV